MNRERKFKGWNKKTNEMMAVISIQELACRPALNETNVYEYIEFLEYTGVKDSNDVEIYEGDIVKYKNPKHWSEKKNFEVKFNNGMFMAGFHNGSSTRKKPKLVSNRLVVIGNMFENPELLNNE